MSSTPSHLFEIAVRAQGDAVCITDSLLDPPGPQILFVNEAFTRLTGYAAEDVVGRSPRILQGPLTERGVMDLLRRRLEQGKRFVGEAINYRKDGRPFVMHWSIDSVSPNGSVSNYVAVQRDVTGVRQLERLRAADRGIANAMVGLADSRDFERAVDQALVTVHEQLAWMLMAGKPFVVTRIDGRWRTVPETDSPQRARLLAALRSSTSAGETVAAPFPTAGVPGGLVVDGLDGVRRALVDPGHVADLAATAGRGLEALWALHDRRREVLALQRVLLPAPEFELGGLSLDTHYQPSRRTEQAGGDWYDAVTVDGTARAVIGDVAGKGLRAAAEMGLIRSHLHALLTSGVSLEEAVVEADRFCVDEGIVATAAIVDLDDDTGQMTAVSAGHPPPLLVGSGDATFFAVQPVAPLGAFRAQGPPPVVTSAQLADRCLVLYTDGALDERRLRVDEGLEHLRSRMAGAGPGARSVRERFVEITDLDRDDDTAMLAISRASG